MEHTSSENIAEALKLLEEAAMHEALALEKGMIVLSTAVADGSSELVRLLLEAGADPWAVNVNGKTALDLAQSYPNAQKRASARVLEAWMKTHPKPKK